MDRFEHKDQPHRLPRAPSFPDLRLQPQMDSSPSTSARSPESPTPTSRTPTGQRPRLCPLDLAQAPKSSHTLITPPLTPSSLSGQEALGNSPRTPPEPGSPLAARWARSLFIGSQTSPKQRGHGTPGHLSPTTQRSGSLTSSTGDSVDSLDVSSLIASLKSTATSVSDSDSVNASDFDLDAGSDNTPSRFLLVGNVPNNAQSSSLKEAFTGCGDVKGILPRFQADHGVVILAFFDTRDATRAQRFLSSQISTAFGGRMLSARFITATTLERYIGRSAFVAETEGDLSVTADDINMDPAIMRDMLASFGQLQSLVQVDHRVYRVEYFDVRHASAARDLLAAQSIRGVRLVVPKFDSAPASPAVIPFPSVSSSHHRGRTLSVAGSNVFDVPDTPSPVRVRNLSGASLPLIQPGQRRRTGSSPPDSPHHASFPDSPAPSSSTTNNTPRKLATWSQQPPNLDDQDTSPRRLYFNNSGKVRPRSISVSAGNQDASEDGTRMEPSIKETSAGLEPMHGSRPSNSLFFDSTAIRSLEGDNSRRSLTAEERPTAVLAAAPGPHQEHGAPRQLYPVAHNASIPAETYSGYWMPPQQAAVPVPVPTFDYGYINYPPPNPSPPRHPDAVHPSFFYSPTSPVFPTSPTTPYDPRGYTPSPAYDYSLRPPFASHYPVDYFPHAPVTPGPQYAYAATQQHGPPRALVPPPTASSDYIPYPPSAPAGSVPSHNQLNLAKIEGGVDTRTTVMIKNIPNKMTDQDLLSYIEDVCPRRIDFLYLRMDFQNGCNVGYAFVNFITVQDLLQFAKARLGIKWNMYSSEKVLHMSYANYQGKEALIEKFRNSCIMDEREAWRPKIFFSDGPNQGQPEPFPAPTHLRRKERSSHNRGTLYVPNAGGAGLRHHLGRDRMRNT